MKQHIERYIIWLFVAFGCMIAAGCQDDTFRDFFQEGDGNGLDVYFTVNLPSMAMTELSTRGAAGDIIKEFKENIHVYVYNENGTERILHCGYQELENYVYEENGNTDHPEYPYGGNKYEGVTSGETATPRATFKLKNAPFEVGQTYQIYVTANVTVPEDQCKTADDLKQYTVDWNKDNMSENAEMFGMFALNKDMVEGEKVTFSGKNRYDLHAWLIRCASKVTIDFNTTQLNEQTWIYLHNVKICNVPKECHLGKSNIASEDGVDGDKIIYAPGYNYENAETEYGSWPVVLSRGTGTYGSDHSETAEALFFYENLQGTGKDKSQVDTDKTDTPDDEVSWPGGVADGNYGWRDEKPYGTYIEVEAYYHSRAKGNEGQGKIKYRFMLGMDTFKDYNAYRNHHYKLTLNFRGNANDVDWHIEYEQNNDNPIYVPSPFYISYTYGESVEIPITVDGKLSKGTKIIAEIVENNWQPKDAPASIYWTGNVQSSDGVNYDGPWHGFLTLRPTNSLSNVVNSSDNVTNADAIGRETELTDIANNKRAYLMSYWYGGVENMPNMDNTNKSQFFTSAEIEKNEHMYVPMQGYREYDTTIRNGRTADNTRNNPDSYEIIENTNGSKTKTHIYLPLYTRALFMVKTLGYSGANPYFNYQRKAVVKITCWVDDENGNPVKYSKLCDVIQVRRIINPAGIYRAKGDNKSFTVNLCFRTAEKATSFMTFASEGKWSAEIESGDAGFITLNGQQKIQGSTGSQVKFQVHFIPNASAGNRYAVILVKYHDYTCKHRIMVRQGYEPDEIVEGGVKWHCFNLRGSEKEAESPLEAGSQFRFGNLDYAIDAQYNTTEQFGIAPGESTFTVVGKDGEKAGEVPWYVNNKELPGLDSGEPNLAFEAASIKDSKNFKETNFKLYDKPANDPNRKQTNEEKNTRMTKYEDWKSVRDNAHIFYTFGVCYDGNSTSTSMAAEQAFNYKHASKNKNGSGMRGAFIYNSRNGKNLFLPIGASGYGRRKSGKTNAWGNNDMPGTLRYANRSVYMPVASVVKMPQFWNIKDNLGAIYWGFPNPDNPTEDIWDKNSTLHGFTAWDINVSTYDFNQFSDNAYSWGDNDVNHAGIQGSDGKWYFSDSGFIRLVDD